jgi:hypothetical protein
MDFGGWIDKLVDLNAKEMGMNQTYANYTLERLGCKRFSPSLAVACATLEHRSKCECVRNMISVDGIHWCLESLGGRVVAATACLLQCSLLTVPDLEFNSMGDNSSHRPMTKEIQRQCEQRCNDEFMSLRKASALSSDVGFSRSVS